MVKLGPETGTALALNQYNGQSSVGSVLWGGMVNLSTRIGSGTKLAFNNTLTRGADNSVENLSGLNEEYATDFAFSRITYIQRSVRTNQLLGNHLIGQRNFVTWQVATSGINRDEPDRSDIGYLARPGTDGRSSPTSGSARPASPPAPGARSTRPAGTWAPTGSTASARSTVPGS